MSNMTEVAPMSAAQLGDLALDAAMQIDRFMAHDGLDLDCARTLLSSLLLSLRSGTLDGDEKPRKFELSYLPIYECVVKEELSGSAEEFGENSTVEGFSTRVQEVLDRFLTAERYKDEALLPKMRDLCLAVHDQALSEQLDVVSANQPTLRRGSTPH